MTFRNAILSPLLVAMISLAPAFATAAPPEVPMPKAVAVKSAPAPAPVADEPTLTGPASATYMVELKAKSVPAASALRWQVYVKNKDGDYVLAVGKVQTRTVLVEKAFLFAGPAGEYLVQCTFQKGQEFVDLEWRGQLTGGVTPPVPPGPNPPTPVDDPLLKVLQAAYDAETDATKAADVKSLAAVMRALSEAVKDSAVKNGDDNFNLIHNSIEARIGGRLKGVRAAAGGEINKILPNGPNKGTVALTDQNRKDAAALYLKLADLLDKLKN